MIQHRRNGEFALVCNIAALAVFGACALAAGSLLAEEPSAITPQQERFFEEKVRPLLAANCWDCHGSKKQESGLRLDSQASMSAPRYSEYRRILC